MCHTFDASADGYGRAEGVGALCLKRLDDAVRDGDVIRSVIRSSACNTNGKVPGYGITFPSIEGQERVIRHAYERAGLDPNRTAYFETHGTGTPVGDPIEVQAVSRAMNDTRSPDKPLVLGAIKPNIGHSEAASGIFAIFKASLMVEKAIIPGVAGLKNLNPAIHEDEWNVVINRDARAWPVGFETRRVSISSFGYGGTNAHVIVENVEALVPNYAHAALKAQHSTNEIASDVSEDRPLLLTMSAHDKTTLANNIRAHAAVVDHYDLHDFVYTLNNKRSVLSTKGFVITTDRTASRDMHFENFKSSSSSTPLDKVAFIFTGQGAAWPTMGREAIKHFPLFRGVIRKLDLVLKGLQDHPNFLIEQQLSCSEEESQLHHPNVAQATLTAIQIATVDLLASWGIVPEATIGHSAGEIAASYAAGLISAPAAIVASYYRGYCLRNLGPSGGSMLAVGKGVDDLDLSKLGPNLSVACENSPNSVTLSGPSAEIEQAREMFTAQQVFAREVRTGMAYHSKYMQSVAEPMANYIDNAVAALDNLDHQWRRVPKPMLSTVTNKMLNSRDVDGRYWAMNLTNPVKFNTGLSLLASSGSLMDVRGFVEVGPHSALSGPFKQICQSNKLSFVYVPTIVRSESNAAISLLKTVGQLFLEGYPVNLLVVNKSELKERSSPRTVVDLPRYQWNYEKLFWAEPRASFEYRHLTHARHDVLGRRILGLSDNNIAWRNVLRLKDVPWLEDHKLGGSIIFPCAGHLALAIEAIRQRCDILGLECIGTNSRNVELKEALVIPPTDAGIEIQVRLTTSSSSKTGQISYSFAVESVSNNDTWTIHCTGTCTAQTVGLEPPSKKYPVNFDDLTQRHSGKTWNEAFQRVGFEYGRQFGALDRIRTHGKYESQAAGKIPIATKSGRMKDETRYFLHPATVDSLLQLIIIAIHGGDSQEMPWGVIPVGIDEVTVRHAGESEGTLGDAGAWLPEGRTDHSRRFVSNGVIFGKTGEVVLDIRGLHTLAYEAALPPKDEATLPPMLYSGVSWKLDLDHLDLTKAFDHTDQNQAVSGVISLVEMANHRRPLKSLLSLDDDGEVPEEDPLRNTSLITAISLASNNEGIKESSRLAKLSFTEGQFSLETVDVDEQDFVILGTKETAQLLETGSASLLRKHLSKDSHAALLLESSEITKALNILGTAGLESTVVSFVDKTLIWSKIRTNLQTNESVSAATPTINLVYSPQHSASPNGLAANVEACGISVTIQTLGNYISAGTSNDPVVLFNPNANLLTAADPETFEHLKRLLGTSSPILWLTTGVNQGQNPSASTVAGLLRVVREENKTSIASVLDYDTNTNLKSLATAIIHLIAPENDPRSSESEYWLHDGLIHVSRVVPNNSLNTRMIGSATSNKPTERILQRGEYLQGGLISGTLIFSGNDRCNQFPIGVSEVDIQVEALEFQKNDMQFPSVSPRLVYGTVIEAGSEVRQTLKGKPIITYSSSGYNTIVRVQAAGAVEFPAIPEDVTKLIRSIPTIMQALSALQAASVSAQKTVFLMPLSSVLSNSMRAVCRSFGFQLVIIQDDAKSEAVDHLTTLHSTDIEGIKQALKKAGPASVVIVEDFSDLSQRIWRDIPARASFVVSSPTLDTALDAAPSTAPFSRGARFIVSNLASSLMLDPIVVGGNLQAAIAIAERENCVIGEDSTVTLNHLVSSTTTLPDASVLSFNYEKDTINVVDPEFSIRFSSEDAYLLVGCLGGLGRSLTTWMWNEEPGILFSFLDQAQISPLPPNSSKISWLRVLTLKYSEATRPTFWTLRKPSIP